MFPLRYELNIYVLSRKNEFFERNYISKLSGDERQGTFQKHVPLTDGGRYCNV
jgi:hypothetical protein